MHQNHTWKENQVNIIVQVSNAKSKIPRIYSYMRSSAAIWRWNLDLSSFRIDESISFPLANSTFPRWRIAATTLKIASWQRKTSYSNFTLFISNDATNKLRNPRLYLVLLTYSHNIHSSPSGKIVLSITYTDKFIATWLIQIVKRFRTS